MKIGIFGGSFNPIHNGHLGIIKKTLEHKLVDELWIVPCKNHPLDKTLASAYHRVNMIELAINGMDNVRIEDYEINKEGKNYTSETMHYLENKYPHEFYFVMASDLLKDMDKWQDYDYIKKMKFIVFQREGIPIIKNEATKALDMIVLEDKLQKVSSSGIRKKFLSGEDISKYVPRDVARYIQEKDVYVDDTTAHKNPSSTVDLIVPYDDGFTKGLVLIKRGEPPYKDCWCFPGGHLEYGRESLEEAAVRELREETNLITTSKNLKLLGAYSDPGRDPRGHVVSHTYIVEGYSGILKEGSDAAKVGVFKEKPKFMAFDHSKMWDDYENYLKKNKWD